MLQQTPLGPARKKNSRAKRGTRMMLTNGVMTKLHDDALLIRIHLAILVEARHVLVEALLGFYFVGEPFFEEGG
jgi:hypothetical protein